MLFQNNTAMMRQENHLRFDKCLSTKNGCLDQDLFIVEKEDGVRHSDFAMFVCSGRYFDEISQDTGKYCFGVDDTLRALEMGAVDILIVWENIDIQRFVLKNHTTDGKLCFSFVFFFDVWQNGESEKWGGHCQASHLSFADSSDLVIWLVQWVIIQSLRSPLWKQNLHVLIIFSYL